MVDWAVVVNFSLWAVLLAVLIVLRIVRNREKLKVDIDKLRDGKFTSEDLEAFADLVFFVLGLVSEIGGTKNVRELLEKIDGERPKAE